MVGAVAAVADVCGEPGIAAAMIAYVALLHSIVIDRARRVVMSDLRQIAEAAGFHDARTLVSTGNLVLQSETVLPVSLVEQRLEDGIRKAYGKHIDVIAMTAADWLRLTADNPFVEEGDADGSRVSVRAMRAPLAEAAVARLQSYCTPQEKIALVSGHLWLSFSGKPSETRLLPQLTTKRLGVGTVRNWNTVKGLAAMVAGEQQILYSGPQTH